MHTQPGTQTVQTLTSANYKPPKTQHSVSQQAALGSHLFTTSNKKPRPSQSTSTCVCLEPIFTPPHLTLHTLFTILDLLPPTALEPTPTHDPCSVLPEPARLSPRFARQHHTQNSHSHNLHQKNIRHLPTEHSTWSLSPPHQ